MTAIAIIFATQLYPEHGHEQSPAVGEKIGFAPLAVTAIPGSNPTPAADETRTSPPRPLDYDLPAAVVKRKSVRLAEPLEEEHVLDEGIKAAEVPQESEHQGAAEKSRDMASASKMDPREQRESVPGALTAEQNGTMPAMPAEPADRLKRTRPRRPSYRPRPVRLALHQRLVYALTIESAVETPGTVLRRAMDEPPWRSGTV